MLKCTRYTSWDGIFDHHAHLTNLQSFDFPVPDPHNSPDEILPSMGPKMREINLFAKALTDYGKAIRIFIRAAMRYRYTCAPHANSKYFWVRNGVMSQSVTLILALFLDTFFGIDAWICTVTGYFPPKEGMKLDTPIDMRFNLLGPRVYGHEYQGQNDLYLAVVHWLFGLRTNSSVEQATEVVGLVDRNLKTGELRSPNSCFYDTARNGESWVHGGESPKIDPHGVDDERNPSEVKAYKRKHRRRRPKSA
jgi:hypothetical protein